MENLDNLNKMHDKNCLIVGQPSDLMREIMLLLSNNGCEVNIGIDFSNEKEVFLANSILNESWAMGKNGKIIEIKIKEQRFIRKNSKMILNQMHAPDILIII